MDNIIVACLFDSQCRFSNKINPVR